MKKIVITRIDKPGYSPWKDQDGNYSVLHPDNRFAGKAYAADYEKVTSLLVLKSRIESGYSVRMVHESGGSPVLIVAENLRIEVTEIEQPVIHVFPARRTREGVL